MAEGDVVMWIKFILYMVISIGFAIVAGMFWQQLSNILKEIKKINKHLEKRML